MRCAAAQTTEGLRRTVRHVRQAARSVESHLHPLLPREGGLAVAALLEPIADVAALEQLVDQVLFLFVLALACGRKCGGRLPLA